MSIEITEKQWSDIAHTLGVSIEMAERSKMLKDKLLPDKFYRNFFAGSKNESFEILVEQGICGTYKKWHETVYFITEEGKERFREYFKRKVTSKYVKPSKSKRVYLEFIDSEYGNSFSDYLGIINPKINYENRFEEGGRIRVESQRYSGVNGDWCKTIKEAKESYKLALKEYKKENNLR